MMLWWLSFHWNVHLYSHFSLLASFVSLLFCSLFQVTNTWRLKHSCIHSTCPFDYLSLERPKEKLGTNIQVNRKLLIVLFMFVCHRTSLLFSSRFISHFNKSTFHFYHCFSRYCHILSAVISSMITAKANSKHQYSLILTSTLLYSPILNNTLLYSPILANTH